MADIAKLRQYVETYGIAVRAGVITPTLADEIEMRKRMGLPPVNDAITQSWEDSGGIRAPITLAKDEAQGVSTNETA